jgi:hypothetical protein
MTTFLLPCLKDEVELQDTDTWHTQWRPYLKDEVELQDTDTWHTQWRPYLKDEVELQDTDTWHTRWRRETWLSDNFRLSSVTNVIMIWTAHNVQQKIACLCLCVRPQGSNSRTDAWILMKYDPHT